MGREGRRRVVEGVASLRVVFAHAAWKEREREKGDGGKGAHQRSERKPVVARGKELAVILLSALPRRSRHSALRHRGARRHPRCSPSTSSPSPSSPPP